jgi:hypothetical protein
VHAREKKNNHRTTNEGENQNTPMPTKRNTENVRSERSRGWRSEERGVRRGGKGERGKGVGRGDEARKRRNE